MRKLYVFEMICLVSLMAAAACEKDVHAVQDSGPRIAAQSQEKKLVSNAAFPVEIKREDPTSGPMVTIKVSGAKSLSSVARSVICGTVTLKGKSPGATNSDSLTFQISEQEFAGLTQMPENASCKLVITATNEIGSQTTAEFPITLTFDSPAPLEVTRTIAVAGNNPVNSRLEIILERYILKSSLSYDVGLTYIPRRSVTAIPHYSFYVQQGNPNDSYYMVDQPTTIAPTRVEVVGDVVQPTGNMTDEASFEISAHGTAVVTSYGLISPNITTTEFGACRSFSAVWNFTSDPCIRRFLGIYVTAAQEAPSLSVWHDFKPTSDDSEKPAYVTPTAVTPVPGTVADNAYITHPLKGF